ncbi:MAG: molybdate ABC transporter substrate-binding protein [Rhodothermales bacterium]|nr:molybdate ABC transporter substrate-binding protein [Rhodothermales bacterium]
MMAALVLASCGGEPAPLRIAVASNFHEAARELAVGFPGAEVIPGSTGKHVAQVLAGAPYDVLLAADTVRYRVLEGPRRIYARGILAAWSPSADARTALASPDSRIALANPDLAPYGTAAEQALTALRAPGQRVFGENVAQAYQFARAGGVDVALVSWAQLSAGERAAAWRVPDSLYSPIVQGAVLLSDKPEARRFWDYLASPDAARMIERSGYLAPE